jgi:hypothetical protein
VERWEGGSVGILKVRWSNPRWLSRGLLRHVPERLRIGGKLPVPETWCAPKLGMKRAIQLVRTAHPEIDYTFSQTTGFDTWRQQDASMLDFMEPHIWMGRRLDTTKKLDITTSVST